MSSGLILLPDKSPVGSMRVIIIIIIVYNAPVDDKTFQQPSTATDRNARVDIVAGGVWGSKFDRVFSDVCAFNAFAQSNTARSPSSTYDFN